MTELPRQTEIGDLVADRYRVDELLGRGGMASVYRATDLRTGKACALKRGRADNTRKTQRRGALLEREYHTLAQLAHPRIIEVYEYGVDANGPFYTMELLAGSDLSESGRVPWRQACALLCDVASSLAILHARGLLHRDLSLRNIRSISEGRAKLIDFGAMAPMGVCKDIQGTAPFIAPEVLQLQELDARADLFALGAAGYYLLTGRNAYPARRIYELRDVWRSRPIPPERLSPDIPAPLSALILQLLSLDRGARPKSAPEVMERLSAIAGLSLEEHVEVSRAYLATPALVGRDDALVTARREILSLVRREGGTLVIDGESGSGRSRMLDACVLEGKLLGMTVVRADAGDAAEGDFGVARSLCNQLGALMPDIAAKAARLSRDVLAHVLDLDQAGTTQAAPAPERSLLLRELREYVLSFAQAQPLLFVIDDVDLIDEPSAALLAAVANKAKRHALLLVAALRRARGPSMSAPVRLLRLLGQTIELTLLSEAQTLALLQSIFGDVANLQLVAARVHALAQGSPRATLDIAQHLVERGLARYAAGSWLLPAQLEEGDLPGTLAEALWARVEALGPDARALVELQAVADGEALDVAAYSELARIDAPARVFAALDELVATRVFSLDGDGYRFSQRSFVPVVMANLDREAARRLHARVADLMRQRGSDALRLAEHLLAAERSREAVELLLRLDLPANLPPVPVLERAIEEAEALRLPAKSLHQLREALVTKASLVLAVESFQRHLPHVLTQLEKDSGLALYHARSDLPHADRLREALGRAQAQYLATPEEQRIYAPIDAIRALARLSSALCSFAVQLYDLELLDSLPSLAPLEGLSPALAIVGQVMTATKHWIAGRYDQYHALSQQILARISEPDRGGLDPAHHKRTRLGLLFGVGLFEAGTGSDRAEPRAAELEQDRDFRVNAWRIRVLKHLKQGNLEEAKRCERRAELLYLQEHGGQSYAGMGAGAEVSARAEAGDLLGVKSALETLAMMAQRHERWRAPYLGGLCRYRMLQGDLPGALDAIESAMASLTAGRHNAFVALAATHVRVLRALGRVDEGLALGRSYLATSEREQLGGWIHNLRTEMAEVMAVAGQHDDAIAMIEAVIASAEAQGRAGLALGSAYESRARIAIHMRDKAGFTRAAERCAGEYQKARNPALSARFAQLLEDGRQHQLAEGAASAVYRELLALPEQLSEYNTVHSRILECVDASDRARCALSLLLQSTESGAGYLFGMREGRVQLLAALPEQPLDATMLEWIDDCLRAAQASDEMATTEGQADTTRSSAVQVFTDAEGRTFQPLFLIASREQRGDLAAVLVLHVATGLRNLPPRTLMQELARELLDYGDVHGGCVPS